LSGSAVVKVEAHVRPASGTSGPCYRICVFRGRLHGHVDLCLIVFSDSAWSIFPDFPDDTSDRNQETSVLKPFLSLRPNFRENSDEKSNIKI